MECSCVVRRALALISFQQEMRNKESIMKLLQHENDTYRRKQRQLTKYTCNIILWVGFPMHANQYDFFA